MQSERNIGASISLLTYNRSKLLRNVLLSLQNLRYEPLEIIVIDNHSEDNTEGIVANEFPRARYIRTEKNIGAAARNIGMKIASGEIVITLDDDVIGIDDNSIIKLVSRFANQPRLGAINFRVVDTKGNICSWAHHCDPGSYSNREFLTYEITEGAVAFRKEALEKVGYYPEDFFLSHEGPDLAFRILDSSYEVIYSDIVSVTHYYSDLGRKSWLNYYFDTRNQLWLAARNFPFSYACIFLLRGLPSTLIYSIRDGYLFYWLKAVRDAITGLRNAFRNRNVLSDSTMKMIRMIDNTRPSLKYLIKARLLRKGVRL